MVTIGMNYEVRPGMEKVFEDACARVLEIMARSTGHDRSRIYREVGAGSRSYLIVSLWTSEEAFQAFTASDQFKKVTNWGKENVLDGRPVHTTYREG